MMKIKYLLQAILLILITVSCKDTRYSGESDEIETMNSGKFVCYCDNSLYDLMKEPVEWYKETHPAVTMQFEKSDARQTMAKLFNKEAKVIILSRDYLRDEDSLLTVNDIKKHTKIKLAQDAIVFFTKKDFPLDTINASQITEILSNNKNLKDYYTELEEEPTFVVKNIQSAEYSNLSKISTSNKIIKKLKFENTIDSVKQYVLENDNSIGIAYLSHIAKDTSRFKMLRVGWMKEGKRIRPLTVHQSYVLMGTYPYVVNYWAYLQDDVRSKPHYWFATYLEKEAKVTAHYTKMGIVAEFARYEIIPN